MKKENWGTKESRLRDTVIVFSWVEIVGQETVKVIGNKTVENCSHVQLIEVDAFEQ